MKFFLFTQLSGLLMLLAILALYFVHDQATGVYTFDYPDLLGTHARPRTGMWLMLGFFVAFAVKLPVVPSAHLAAGRAHRGAHGRQRDPGRPAAQDRRVRPAALRRAALSRTPPMSSRRSRWRSPSIGILYGAMLAFGQTDLKRLVAYTSVSHLGFVLLGIFAWNPLALQGAVMTMICHGVSTGALFILVGALQERMHTRDIERMGGLWEPCRG